MTSMIVDLLFGLILIGAFLFLGVLVMRGAGFAPSSVFGLAMAFPLGAGLLTWLLFLASWAGLPLTLFSTALVYLLAVGLLAAIPRWRNFGQPFMAMAPSIGRASWHALLLVGLALILVTAAFVSIGRAHGRWDAAAGWVVKGYGIFLEGDVQAGARWGAWGLAYPLNLHIQNGLFSLIGAEGLPASKLLFPFYFASILATVYVFWSRQRLAAAAIGVGLLLLATNPMLMLHATIGYANLPLAAYLVPGGLLAILAMRRNDRRFSLLSGIYLALAAWTRPEGIAYVLAIIGALLVMCLLLTRGLPDWRLLALQILPVIVLAASWFVFSWTSVEQSHLGKAMGGVWPSIQAGEYRLRELYLIPRLLAERAIEPATWGILFPAAALVLLFGLVKKARLWRFPDSLLLIVLAAAVSLVPVGLFYVRSFTRYTDFIPLLNRSFDRAFLPASILIVAMAFVVAFADESAADSPAGHAA